MKKNQIINWVKRYQKRKDRNVLLNLYNAIFFKTRNAILKHFYYSAKKLFIDPDDVTQIMDQTFYKCLKKFTCQINSEDKDFEIYFYSIAKFDLLQEYRNLNQKNQKALTESLSENTVKKNLFDKNHSYEFEDAFVLEHLMQRQMEEDEQLKQMEFVHQYYSKITVGLNKLILFYKLQMWKTRDIAKKLNLQEKEVSRRWSYIKRKIQRDYKESST